MQLLNTRIKIVNKKIKYGMISNKDLSINCNLIANTGIFRNYVQL